MHPESWLKKVRLLGLGWIVVLLGGCASLSGPPEAIEPSFELEPMDRIYHQLAIGFLRKGDLETASHNAQHALERTYHKDHALQMVDVIIYLDTNHLRQAERMLNNMVGAFEEKEIAPVQSLHLELAVAAIREGDVAEALHQLTHYHDAVSGVDRINTREAIKLLEEGDMHEAEHLVEELMGLTPHED